MIQHHFGEEEMKIIKDTTSASDMIFAVGSLMIMIFPCVFQMCVHLTFFINASFTQKWSYIWSSLEKIIQDFKFDQTFHRQVRRVCLKGFFVFLIVSDVLRLSLEMYILYWMHLKLFIIHV